MKPRDLLPIIERVRRQTNNGDVVTICDALQARLVKEMADGAAAVGLKNLEARRARRPDESVEDYRRWVAMIVHGKVLEAPAEPASAPLPAIKGKAGVAFQAAAERAGPRAQPKPTKKPRKPWGRRPPKQVQA